MAPRDEDKKRVSASKARVDAEFAPKKVGSKEWLEAEEYQRLEALRIQEKNSVAQGHLDALEKPAYQQSQALKIHDGLGKKEETRSGGDERGRDDVGRANMGNFPFLREQHYLNPEDHRRPKKRLDPIYT
jgi:hypothetical protein